MGKKLSAAQKQQISATLKRKWAEKKARLAAPQDKTTARIDTLKLHKQVEAAPRSSKDDAVQLAIDVVNLLSGEVSSRIVVGVIGRILRP